MTNGFGSHLYNSLYEQACERSATDWADEADEEADWRYQEHRDRLLMEQWEREA